MTSPSITTHILDDRTTQRANLLTNFEQLSALDREILQVISIIFTPTSRTAILACLAKIGTKSLKQKKLTSATIRPTIKNLLNAGVLLQETGKLRCHPLVIEIASRDAVDAGKFSLMASAIESCVPFKRDWQDKDLFFESPQQFIRAFRMGFYQKDFKVIARYSKIYYSYGFFNDRITMDEVLNLVCNNPFNRDWFLTLPLELADLRFAHF